MHMHSNLGLSTQNDKTLRSALLPSHKLFEGMGFLYLISLWTNLAYIKSGGCMLELILHQSQQPNCSWNWQFRLWPFWFILATSSSMFDRRNSTWWLIEPWFTHRSGDISCQTEPLWAWSLYPKPSWPLIGPEKRQDCQDLLQLALKHTRKKFNLLHLEFIQSNITFD